MISIIWFWSMLRTGIFLKIKFSKFLQTHFTSPIPIRMKKKLDHFVYFVMDYQKMPFRSTNFIMLHGLVFIVLRINNFIATAANVSGRREMGVGLNCSKETLFLVKLRKREFDNYWLELTYCICISWFFLKEVFFFFCKIFELYVPMCFPIKTWLTEFDFKLII